MAFHKNVISDVRQGVNTIADESFCNFDENEKRKGLFKPIKLIKK